MSAAGWLVEALIASALLMAAVLVLRAPVRRAFGSQVAYGLWALPLLRLVMPPVPASWHAAALPAVHPGHALAVIIDDRAADAVMPALAPVASSTLLTAGAIVWLSGAALFLLYHVLAHRRFCRRIERSVVAESAVGGCRILTSRAAPGPLAYGLWRPAVALPADFAGRYAAGERALVLAHELGHHRRGDLYANWAALAVLALHWFDPLAWLAFRAFRADQELANDAGVLADRSATERHLYARALVKTARGAPLSPACHLHTVADLKGRLKMLATSPKSRRRLASGAASVAALAVAGLALTASATGAAAIGRQVEQAAALMPPVPAPAPIAAAAAPADRPVADTPARAGEVKRVLVVRNGKATSYAAADVDAHLAAGETVSIQPLAPASSRMILKMPDDPSARIEVQDVPEVGTATCGIGTGKPASMTIMTTKGERRRLIVCTDRIRMVTASAVAAEASARTVEHDAYAQALAGLVDARAKAVADTGLSDGDRIRALAGIDQAITEMRSQLARGR